MRNNDLRVGGKIKVYEEIFYIKHCYYYDYILILIVPYCISNL